MTKSKQIISVSSMVTAISLVAAIATGIFAVESRYAKASELQKTNYMVELGNLKGLKFESQRRRNFFEEELKVYPQNLRLKKKLEEAEEELKEIKDEIKEVKQKIRG